MDEWVIWKKNKPFSKENIPVYVNVIIKLVSKHGYKMNMDKQC